eukprot:CAMPEP_0201282416 /NCGR_PEP_ID=MMETSP1317-20130820/5607_1 /ASSEMBLY_ACC=CAM_ASM_000770 /TAXON_ID=187299 /ORGANISM="Undescribed Undescribed, Strain Undescribed" /LENGTH=76 /DNA_ID=CAMNT_0047595017 /DNA_START=553 /DNA_END=783 /DNA_ORIENTATION=+
MTALRILQRMKRDWMTIGRRPTGLCGAALYLSARIHGEEKTEEEIETTMPISKSTIHKRLLEFKISPAAALTMETF